jgi:hypothetical protein
MTHLVGLAAVLAASVVAPLWMARAILGVFLSLLLRDQMKRQPQQSIIGSTTESTIRNPQSAL